jgi:HEAT repeat protein
MAVESLGKVGDPRAVDAILLLKHDQSAIVREASVLAMGRLKPIATDGVVALLIQALEDPHESVREAAVVAIGEVEPDPRLLQPVVGLLHSSDATIRRTVVQALLQIDSSQWVPSLVAAGGDVDAEVRQGVVAALGEWGSVTASSWIRERLVEDPSPGVRAEAAYRLGLLGDPEAKAALNRTIVNDPDSGVRRWAQRGM